MVSHPPLCPAKCCYLPHGPGRPPPYCVPHHNSDAPYLSSTPYPRPHNCLLSPLTTPSAPKMSLIPHDFTMSWHGGFSMNPPPSTQLLHARPHTPYKTSSRTQATSHLSRLLCPLVFCSIIPTCLHFTSTHILTQMSPSPQRLLRTAQRKQTLSSEILPCFLQFSCRTCHVRPYTGELYNSSPTSAMLATHCDTLRV